MSSLWTPGGEVPVGGRPPGGTSDGETAAPAGPSGTADTTDAGDDARLRAQLAEMQQRILQAPAAEVVADHAVGLYELAALHLGQDQPRLADARLAIDALAALLDGLTGRLGNAEAQLRQLLPPLRMAYVQASDRAATDP